MHAINADGLHLYTWTATRCRSRRQFEARRQPIVGWRGVETRYNDEAERDLRGDLQEHGHIGHTCSSCALLSLTPLGGGSGGMDDHAWPTKHRARSAQATVTRATGAGGMQPACPSVAWAQRRPTRRVRARGGGRDRATVAHTAGDDALSPPPHVRQRQLILHHGRADMEAQLGA